MRTLWQAECFVTCDMYYSSKAAQRNLKIESLTPNDTVVITNLQLPSNEVGINGKGFFASDQLIPLVLCSYFEYRVIIDLSAI